MKLPEAVRAFPDAAVFEVLQHEDDDCRTWEVRPMPWATVRETEDDSYLFIKALHVLERGKVEPCYLDLSLPERISDFVYFDPAGEARWCYTYDAEGDVVPAIAIEGFGNYEDFYSRRDPEVGLTVLRNALPLAQRRAPIAEDLGYILRDEDRYEEAIAAFSVAISEGPSCYFILLERANLYEQVGEREKAAQDREAAAVMEAAG